MRKGLFNNHANDVASLFKGCFHVQINARNEDDVSEKIFVEKLTKASGASYDSGQKIQGKASLVPTNVAQGKQQATQSNLKSKTADKSDYQKKNESEQYWSTQKQEEDQRKEQQTKAPSKQDYNKTSERDQFWANQKQETSAPVKTKVEVQGGASSIRSQFENKPVQQPPQRSAPPPRTVEPTPVQETVVEVVQEEYQEPEVIQEEYQEPEVVQEEQPVEQEYSQQPEGESQIVGTARALYSYNGEGPDDLSFNEGDIITVLDTSDASGWWKGELNGVQGYFPSNFAEMQ